MQVGVRLPDPPNAGARAALPDRIGGALRGAPLARGDPGWRLTPDGLHGRDGILHPSATEAAIYAALGLPFIPPEIRNGTDEVAVASRGELPALVSRADIRGDLHMHSLWSDGRDSIDAMVQGCRALGYEYMAITDHSPQLGGDRAT